MMGITKKIDTIIDISHADYGYELTMYDINKDFIQLIFDENTFGEAIAKFASEDRYIKEKIEDRHRYPYTTDGKLFGEEEETKMEIKDDKDLIVGYLHKKDLNERFGIPIHGTYDPLNAIPDSECQCDTEKTTSAFINNAGILDKAKYVDTDNVNHPDHYNTGFYECINVMEEVFGRDAVKDFCLCNTFKYIYRCKHKNNEEEDLEKAEWYLNRLIEMNKEDKE